MSVQGNDRKIDNIKFSVSDISRSKDFYGAVFGWTFVDYGPRYTEFSDGRLSGGFTTGEPVRPGGPLVITGMILSKRSVDSAQQGERCPVFYRAHSDWFYVLFSRPCCRWRNTCQKCN